MSKNALTILILSLLLLIPPLNGEEIPTTDLLANNDHLEDNVSLIIAKYFGLNRELAILTLAIRDHENGERAGKEFGIEYKEKTR